MTEPTIVVGNSWRKPAWPQALEALAEIEGIADAATIVLRIADAVATADGSASAAEITAVQDIAAALNAAAS